jgi:hypothetical protein
MLACEEVERYSPDTGLDSSRAIALLNLSALDTLVGALNLVSTVANFASEVLPFEVELDAAPRSVLAGAVGFGN